MRNSVSAFPRELPSSRMIRLILQSSFLVLRTIALVISNILLVLLHGVDVGNMTLLARFNAKAITFFHILPALWGALQCPCDSLSKASYCLTPFNLPEASSKYIRRRLQAY